MTPLRYFKSTNTLTLPASLQVGAGASHVRLMPGEVVAFDSEKCRAESRFINGRVRAGDLVEVGAAELEAYTASQLVATDTTPAAKAAKGK